MNIIFYRICILSIPLVLSACFFTGHYTAYIKDNIKAVGTRGTTIKGNAIYSTISIGTPSAPFDVLKNKFSIKLSDNNTISTDEMSLKRISEIPNVEKSVAIDGRLKGWEDKANVEFITHNYIFVFNGEKLVFFEADLYRNNQFIPIIGDFNKTMFYKFPITEEQLEILFGKPDKYENKYSL